MHLLKLKYLTSLNSLVNDIKISLKLDIKDNIFLYYKSSNNNVDILNSNKDLFKAIIDYNHNYANNDNKNMNLKLDIKYNNTISEIIIEFMNNPAKYN